MSGVEGNFTYNKGYERIPENWYRRPVDFGLIDLNLDTVALILKYPELGRCVLPYPFRYLPSLT